MAIPEHPYTDADVQQSAQSTPIAGGEQYTPEWADQEPDIVVSEASEFERADEEDLVYIADGEVVDVTGCSQFSLDGTVVAGGRHKPGVEAGMVVSNEAGPGSIVYDGIFKAANQTGHIEGVRIRGPSWYPERAGQYQQDAPTDARCWPGYEHIHKPDPDDPNDNHPNREERDQIRSDNFSRGVNLWASGSTVKNCDVHGFTHAGITVGASTRVPTGVEVAQNLLHNCATPGLGYPLNIYNGEVISKYNYYNQYRHAITGFGHPSLGYVSRFDVFGPDALLTPVDMHCLAENGGSSGDLTAGKYLQVDRSTFLAHTRFSTPTWYSKAGCPAIGIRGHAEESYTTTRCQFLHESREAAFDHRNVDNQFTDWNFSDNEFGLENWTPENGAPIDFESTPAPGSVLDQRGVYQKRGAALATYLTELKNLREQTYAN